VPLKRRRITRRDRLALALAATLTLSTAADLLCGWGNSSAAACTYRARFRLGAELNKVVHGPLSKDKTTGTGVGTFPRRQ
jgi:hypothetical protein